MGSTDDIVSIHDGNAGAVDDATAASRLQRAWRAHAQERQRHPQRPRYLTTIRVVPPENSNVGDSVASIPGDEADLALDDSVLYSGTKCILNVPINPALTCHRRDEVGVDMVFNPTTRTKYIASFTLGPLVGDMLQARSSTVLHTGHVRDTVKGPLNEEIYHLLRYIVQESLHGLQEEITDNALEPGTERYLALTILELHSDHLYDASTGQGVSMHERPGARLELSGTQVVPISSLGDLSDTLDDAFANLRGFKPARDSIDDLDDGHGTMTSHVIFRFTVMESRPLRVQKPSYPSSPFSIRSHHHGSARTPHSKRPKPSATAEGELVRTEVARIDVVRLAAMKTAHHSAQTPTRQGHIGNTNGHKTGVRKTPISQRKAILSSPGTWNISPKPGPRRAVHWGADRAQGYINSSLSLLRTQLERLHAGDDVHPATWRNNKLCHLLRDAFVAAQQHTVIIGIIEHTWESFHTNRHVLGFMQLVPTGIQPPPKAKRAKRKPSKIKRQVAPGGGGTVTGTSAPAQSTGHSITQDGQIQTHKPMGHAVTGSELPATAMPESTSGRYRRHTTQASPSSSSSSRAHPGSAPVSSRNGHSHPHPARSRNGSLGTLMSAHVQIPSSSLPEQGHYSSPSSTSKGTDVTPSGNSALFESSARRLSQSTARRLGLDAGQQQIFVSRVHERVAQVRSALVEDRQYGVSSSGSYSRDYPDPITQPVHTTQSAQGQGEAAAMTITINPTPPREDKEAGIANGVQEESRPRHLEREAEQTGEAPFVRIESVVSRGSDFLSATPRSTRTPGDTPGISRSAESRRRTLTVGFQSNVDTFSPEDSPHLRRRTVDVPVQGNDMSDGDSLDKVVQYSNTTPRGQTSNTSDDKFFPVNSKEGTPTPGPTTSTTADEGDQATPDSQQQLRKREDTASSLSPSIVSPMGSPVFVKKNGTPHIPKSSSAMFNTTFESSQASLSSSMPPSGLTPVLQRAASAMVTPSDPSSPPDDVATLATVDSKMGISVVVLPPEQGGSPRSVRGEQVSASTSPNDARRSEGELLGAGSGATKRHHRSTSVIHRRSLSDGSDTGGPRSVAGTIKLPEDETLLEPLSMGSVGSRPTDAEGEEGAESVSTVRTQQSQRTGRESPQSVISAQSPSARTSTSSLLARSKSTPSGIKPATPDRSISGNASTRGSSPDHPPSLQTLSRSAGRTDDDYEDDEDGSVSILEEDAMNKEQPGLFARLLVYLSLAFAVMSILAAVFLGLDEQGLFGPGTGRSNAPWK